MKTKKLLSCMVVLAVSGLAFGADFGTVSVYPPNWPGAFNSTATSLDVSDSGGTQYLCVGYRQAANSDYQLSANITFDTINEYGFIARATLSATVAKAYYCAFNASSGYFNIVKIINGQAMPPVKDTDFFNLEHVSTGYTPSAGATVKIVFNVYTVGSAAVLEGRLYNSSGTLVSAISAVDDGTVGGSVLTGALYGTYNGRTTASIIDATYGSMAYFPIHKLTGTVTLQGWTAGTNGVAVDVQVQDQSDDSIVGYTKSLDPNGVFVIPVIDGSFKVRVKPALLWLSKIQNVTVSGADQTASFSLTNGDCDGDNEVTTGDVATVNTAMGSMPGDLNWNAAADLDGDLEVTTNDMVIVTTSANAGAVGDEF